LCSSEKSLHAPACCVCATTNWDRIREHFPEEPVDSEAPHRSTRKLKTQDGRHLRRYQRRWLVERFFAWLQWKRRLLVRWEYYATNFLGFVQLASITMLLKQF
jgi:transposase